MIVVAVIFAVLAFICMFKESKVTGLYRTFGVYGRIAAYFSVFCPMGIITFIISFFMPDIPFTQGLLFLGLALFGAFFYWNAYRKCPDFLKGKLIISMLISGLGVTMKVALFFLGFIWKLTGPDEMVDENGNTVYVVGNDVYSGSGEHIGVASADKSKYIKK